MRSRFYTHESARQVVESEGFRLFPFVHVDEARYERIHALEAQVPATQPKYQTISVAMTAYRDMLTDSIPEQIADLQPILERLAARRVDHRSSLLGADRRDLGDDGHSGGASRRR